MTRDAKSDEKNFDIERLQQLMELMEKHDVREIKIQQGAAKYFLRRGPHEVVSAAVSPMAAPQPVVAPMVAASTPQANEPSESPADSNLIEITSPTVGTYYTSPAPGEAPFVKVGDHVSSDSVVCIIEAMKVLNHIPAGCSGTIEKALLNDGDPVEYGQVLFRVKPN